MACVCTKRAQEVMILLICVIGITWQSVDSIADYLEYAVTTAMNIVPFGNASQMGAVALCVPYNRLNGSAYANMTIEEVRRHVFSVHDVVQSCTLTLPNLTQVSCFDVTRVRPYTDPMCQCFAFFELRDLKVPAKTLSYRVNGNLDADLLTFQLKVPSVIQDPGARFWGIKLYKEYQRMTLKRSDHSKKWFLPETYRKLVYSFDRAASDFMPVPYQTKCFKYEETRFVTRNNAIDRCIVDRYQRLDGKKLWPPFVYASEGESTSYQMDRNASTETEERQLLPAVIRACHQKYPYIECRQRIYALNLKSYQYTDTPFEGVELSIEFFPPTRTEIKTTADMTLVDQINSIGGIVSIWIGLSIFIPLSSVIDFFLAAASTAGEVSRRAASAGPPHSASTTRTLLPSSHDVTSNARQRVLQLAQADPESGITVVRAGGRKKKNAQSSRTAAGATGRKGGRVSLLLQTLVYLLCVTGCVIQLKDVIMIYCENPFTNVYMTKPPSRIHLPRLTVCTKLLINESKLREKYPTVYADLLQRNVTPADWRFELTIQQLFNTSIGKADIIDMEKSRFVSGPDLQLEPLSEYFSVRKMMTEDYVCFRTMSPGTVKPGRTYQTYDRDLLSVPKWADLVIDFDKEVGDEVDLYIHYESNFRRSPGSPEKHVIRLNRNRTLRTRQTVYFTRTRRRLFQNHFTSRCIDYIPTLGNSREIMVERCVTHIMNQRFSEMPDDNFATQAIGTGVHFTSNESRTQEVVQECEDRFALQDCDVTYIETTVEANHVILQGDARYAQELGPDSFNLIMYPPGTGYLEITQVLRFSPIGLFAFSGGVIGAWLGLSFLQARSEVLSLVRFCKRLRRSPSQ